MRIRKAHKQPVFLLIPIVVIVSIAMFIVLQKTNNSSQSKKINNETILTVTLTTNGYNPEQINVKKGDRIIWINKSGKPATINSDNHPTHLNSPFLNLGEFNNESSVQVVINEEGTFKYHNHYQPSQKGSITVK